MTLQDLFTKFDISPFLQTAKLLAIVYVVAEVVVFVVGLMFIAFVFVRITRKME